jgi:hypothetical protein
VVSWPFTGAELTAGLRRYFAEPGLLVTAVQPSQSARSGVRGLRVACAAGRASFEVECVVKEPGGLRRTGLVPPGAREAGVYRSLAPHLPMATPALIAADPAGSWLVLETVEAPAEPAGWSQADFDQAVELLAQLHERFWGLADDLGTYPWLARPLTLDFEIHVYAAAYALGKMVRDEWPPVIAHSAPTLSTLGQLISQAERVAQPLRLLPFTLLHGDYWQGNILRDEDGDLIVLDWQQAAIGPGVLDLLVMVTNTHWHHGRSPSVAGGLAGRYRSEIAARLGLEWSSDEWSELWDHALLWRFLQEMLNWAAWSPPEQFEARAAQFEAVWLQPVLEAAARRLAPLPSE